MSCSKADCGNKIYKNNLCRKHYYLENGNRNCSICGSKEYVLLFCNTGEYLCGKHRHQMERHGRILDRTIYDKNEIIKHENYAEIVLYNKKGEIINTTKIDLEDVNRVSSYKWGLGVNGYVFHKKQLLHRYILNITDERVVDHINRNPLDNRKCNLRICKTHENVSNQSIRKDNTSGVKGVCWDKSYNKWAVRIGFKNKTINLGRYENFDEAVKVRHEAELKYFGEFSPLYKLLTEEQL